MSAACQYNIQFPNQLNDLTALKNLAQTLTAAGRLAELQSRPAEALSNYLDVMRFGIESGRGGFMIDALIGIAIEGMGRSHLEKLADHLEATSCGLTAKALESLDSHCLVWDEVLRQEDILQSRISPDVISYLTARLVMHEFILEGRNKAGNKFRENQKETRNLAIQFAARAYELEKGRRLTNIMELVPAYLKAIPQDPVTGKDLVYPR